MSEAERGSNLGAEYAEARDLTEEKSSTRNRTEERMGACECQDVSDFGSFAFDYCWSYIPVKSVKVQQLSRLERTRASHWVICRLRRWTCGFGNVIDEA